MRIGLFTSNRTTIPPEPGIIAASAYLTGLLADGLVRRGHDVTLYAPKGSRSLAKIIDLDLSPPHLDFALTPSEWVKNMNLATKQLYISQLYADAGTYDLIHIQTEPVYLGMPFARFTTTPTIVTNHNIFVPEEKSLIKQYKDIPIVTISRYQAAQATDLNIIGTIYDGIDIDRFSYYGSQKNEGYVYFLGRLVNEKGVDVAIQTAITAGKPLVISGIGKPEYIQETITPHLSDTIRLESTIFGSPLWHDRIGRAKVTLVPIAWEEPFGLVMVESMASGTPVVAFARGAAPEIVVDGVTGYLVNSSDIDIRGDFIIKSTGLAGFAEAVKRIYELSPQDYEAMRAASRKRVIDHFTVDQMVSGYETLYHKIVDSHVKHSS